MVLMRSLASALAPQRRAARAVSTLGGSSSYSSGDGRRAAPRGAVWLGAAALGGAAYEAQESACAGGRVRVVTYNVLSSSLCEPGYFVKRGEDLSPPNRLKRVAALLDAEVAKGAVVCLQEVSRDWSGELHAYFADKGYQFSTGLYGPKKGGDAFCVATYHMPCLFGSGQDKGDSTSLQPHDASYALTSGALGEAFAAYAPPPQADVAPARAFAPVLEPPLTPAYAAAGAEPDFTNFAYTKPMGGERDAFVETLDYIFCSAGQWKVAGVKELRSKHGLDTSKPYPTADEPSDHVMLAADLELV
ncbi:hypothetical protein JL720_16386 [Aureococcus anophagefferens]|nr:hypothetical protein JL720_16386 [Aureococcus anophagefferens]